MLRIGIVAGEASGDLLAAGLIESLREKAGEIRIEGVGGPLMQTAGCRLLYSYERLAVLGLIEVAGRYFSLLSFRNTLVRHFLSNPPDVFIGIDAPDFNLGLEYSLRQKGIKTVHYVSPSVWAWRRYRLRKIKKSTDLMLVLFPFEQVIYEQNAIPVRYTGHPLADRIELQQDKNLVRQQLGLPQGEKLVALMPGSRYSEIDRMLPILLQSAVICHKQKKGIIFVTSVLSGQAAATVEDGFKKVSSEYPGLCYRVFVNHSREVLTAADAGLLTSGTITLEAMLCGLPMAVAYKVNWLSARIIRAMIRVRYVALPNLLFGKEIVKEFIQENCDPEAMAGEVLKLLDLDQKHSTVNTFRQIHLSLRRGASSTAADAILELSRA